MWGRFRDALYLLIVGQTPLERRLRALETDLRDLMGDLDNAVEKMTRNAWKQTKRNARAMPEVDEQLEPQAAPISGRAALKAEIAQRNGFTLHSGT